jgi:hypothetical protein
LRIPAIAAYRMTRSTSVTVRDNGSCPFSCNRSAN